MGDDWAKAGRVWHRGAWCIVKRRLQGDVSEGDRGVWVGMGTVSVIRSLCPVSLQSPVSLMPPHPLDPPLRHPSRQPSVC